jgi:probable addiction module antidote protein
VRCLVCWGGSGVTFVELQGSRESIHSDTRGRVEYSASIVVMKKKKATCKSFDAAAYLDNDAVIAEYLSAAAEDLNPEVFVAALGEVAKARGMAQIAKDAGLGRESLYKTLSAGAHPRFETINSVLHALGVKCAVVAEGES